MMPNYVYVAYGRIEYSRRVYRQIGVACALMGNLQSIGAFFEVNEEEEWGEARIYHSDRFIQHRFHVTQQTHNNIM